MALGALYNALPWQNPREEEARNRYYGKFLGFVRDRADPAKLGRVRVHLPSLFSPDNTQDNWTDWALPETLGLNVPPVGTPVTVEFEQGFVTHPHYTPGWKRGSDASSSEVPLAGKEVLEPTWTEERTLSAGGTGVPISATIPKDTARDTLPKYPYNKVYSSENGHQLELDDSPGALRARYYHPTGTTILVDADGSVHMRSAGAQYFEPVGDFVIALKPGATFKLIYPDGTSASLGPSGFHVTGHQASIMGRQVQRKETNL